MVYLYAPFYNDKSNGVSVIYELVGILNESGIEARVLCFENERYDFEIPEKIKPYYISKAQAPKAVSDEDIVIYSDTTDGNVLKAKNVVYWLLNRPGVLTGKGIAFNPSDVLVAYSALIHQELPQLFLMKDERSLFSRIRSTTVRKEDMVSIYFGKVNIDTVLSQNERLKRILKKYQKINIITRHVPASREQMLEDIAQSDLLISYDPLSNISYEATLLGTPVLMMDDAYNIQNTAFNAGNDGLAFSEDGIEAARGEVQRAFETYSRCLENQRAAAIESIKQILNRVKLVQTDEQALRQNGAVNKKVQGDFEAFHQSVKEAFVSINYPREIPPKTGRIIGLSANVLVTIRRMMDKGEAEETSGMKKVYSIIKPRWVETMYEKLAGDLKCKELLFLMVRRMFLFWKK